MIILPIAVVRAVTTTSVMAASVISRSIVTAAVIGRLVNDMNERYQMLSLTFTLRVVMNHTAMVLAVAPLEYFSACGSSVSLVNLLPVSSSSARNPSSTEMNTKDITFHVKI